MLVIADATARRRWRRDGRRGIRSLGHDAHRGVRERVLQAGVGPADEQAARPQDRSLVPLRARRRHQRARRRARAAPLALMEQIGAGRLSGPIVDATRRRGPPRDIGLRRARLAAVLGLDGPGRRRRADSAALGLEVTSTPDGWTARSPTFRVDLLREVDLIEEVGRHYGFDKLEPTFPADDAPAPRRTRGSRAIGGCGDVLTAAGLTEAITFGFIEAARPRAVRACEARMLVGVANPLSGKFDTLRPSLLPGLVDAVAHNRRHGRRDVALFEIGARFTRHDGEDPRRRRRVDRRRAPSTGRAPAATSISSTSRASLEQLSRRRWAAGIPVRAGDRSVPRRRPDRQVGSCLRSRPDARRRRRAGCSRGRRRARRAAARPDLRGRARLDACARASSTGRSGSCRCRGIRRRARSVDRRRRYLACGDHSWHHSGCELAGDRALHRSPIWHSSIATRARAPGRCGEPVGPADVPGGGSHADRRRSAAELRHDSGRARREHGTAQRQTMSATMAKTATTSVELEPIDRLEEKVKLLVGMVERHEGRAGARRRGEPAALARAGLDARAPGRRRNGGRRARRASRKSAR